jgi:iron-sulfur cluster repair protein YtfE (RIC family)
MSSIRPSQVRYRVLREHGVIREHLDKLAELSAQLQAGDADAFRAAQDRLQSFHQVLRDHIDFEDALLAPALHESDAWGELRARRLTDHHVEQREQLRAVVTRSRSEPPPGLGQLLDALIGELRRDMTAEEREYLSADLLRDDVVADAEDG